MANLFAAAFYFCRIMVDNKSLFTPLLLEWYAQSHRPMPWKGERDPYLIWLSEIILQQTRVEQGWPYFERFRDHYPTVVHLAEAPEDEVMKLWEGLGYYSRARNLHFTAKYIAEELGGRFPETYEDILALKGVGPYTAAAIASFAYDLPHAAVDGNVYRVLSRYFGIATPIDSTSGKKQFAQLASELLDPGQAGIYNQAIIDFGATQCTPKKPDCPRCTFREQCVAALEDKPGAYPVKSKKLVKRKRYFHYLIWEAKEGLLLQKRQQKDIWQHLYEFPLVEAQGVLTAEELRQTALYRDLARGQQPRLVGASRPFKQQLTHQTIIAVFWEIAVSQQQLTNNTSHLMVSRENLAKFAFPKVIDRYLQDKSLYLKMV
ncbi:MAG: A/G-specific adenine glycosylase [Bacteroidota bacterium]